jgi:hypothetical protein
MLLEKTKKTMITTEAIAVLSHANHCDLAVAEVGGA